MNATTNEKKEANIFKHRQVEQKTTFFFKITKTTMNHSTFSFHNLKLNSRLLIIIKNGIKVRRPH
jgi:hypothetical protein